MRFRYCFLSLIAISLVASCGKDQPARQMPEATTPPVDDIGQATPGAAALPSRLEIVRNDSCSFNAPESGAQVLREHSLAVWGYAFDPDSNQIPDAIWIRLTSLTDGNVIAVPAQRGAREDVAAALGRPELLNSGFGVEMDVRKFSPGAYRVSVLQKVGNNYLVCESPGQITLS